MLFTYSFQYPIFILISHIHSSDEKCSAKVYNDFCSLKNKTSCLLVYMDKLIISHMCTLIFAIHL